MTDPAIARSHVPDTSTLKLALWLGIGLVGVYALSKLWTVGSAVAGAASSAINAGTTAAANLWVGLTSGGSTTATPFPIVLPDGSIGDTSQIAWRYDSQGNAYMQWTDGHVYEWSPRNSAGQYTLTQVA